MWKNISFDFSGAKILVTGGTSGLGRGVAEAFREAGGDVTITGTRPSANDYDAGLKGFGFLQLDVENNDSIKQAANAISELDILVNSAGLAFFSVGLDEYDPDIFERAVTMHLTSVYRLSHYLHGKLTNSRLAGGGAIVSMASMSSLFGIDPVPGYGSAKTGLVGMTRVLARHWAKDNIRVNAIAAGLTRSRMTSGVIDDPEISSAQLLRIPMARHGEPEDISGATLFLCSDAASWITGQTLPIDGGFSISG